MRTAVRVARESALWFGAVLGLLAVAAGIAVTVFGCSLLVFRSGSMSPEIDTGALALARPVAATELEPGDIVNVRASDGSEITHRVVEATVRGDEASLVLKGDANSAPDAEVYTVETVDLVEASVPYLGYVVAHALTPPGLVAAASLCLMLFLVSGSDQAGGRGGGPVGRHRSRRAHRSPWSAVPAAVTAVVVGGAASTGGVTGTWAAFNDAATMTTGSFAARTLAAPGDVRCVNEGFNDYIAWTAPTAFTPTGYRITYTRGATTTTQDVATTPLQWRPPAGTTADYTVRVATIRGSWVSAMSPAPGPEISSTYFFITFYGC